ncbi:phosphonate metabolism protein/1,5-bisphosphokinase (PRPP-forming) PhnN [Rhizobium sp. NTR19]|uniref:Ribose 1,5-bisphosphate phosphokinase PhnN n=1 Tax=Neorhizobium turbinariae TaxID=2937795 RepID=A0ABT0IW26_9HYPH|nr:phosphonate metabolism protein/1,5-bisphosphokinase (PRPP-forming) PhnN [Neorhizobium turbinariae]MCK8782045.1 phosphonate metabolism protein/1,5-bisphosphokinase (PRPP-forming) PhnN [Neorhizobium turbinariae]
MAKAKPGCMAVVVGPSGAGKDTLIARAAAHFGDRDGIVFVRRIITRDAAAGGEDHDGVGDAEFEALAASGGFAVSWDAHGLRYGIPVETRQAVETGRLVIANGSRSALPHFKAAYPRLVVFNVTARPEVLARRLAERGRETEDEIRQRLARSSLEVTGNYQVVTIDNSDSLEVSAGAFIAALQELYCGTHFT